MEFQQEKDYRDEIVREVEALGKSLTKVWTSWAVYARDCAKTMAIERPRIHLGVSIHQVMMEVAQEGESAKPI